MENPWIHDNLTEKQAEYIALVASGLSTLNVAQRNRVSHHTVRNTIAKAKERVGATSTSNLIAMAVSKGWIVLDDSEVPFVYRGQDD